MKALITGINGFIGIWLAKELTHRNHSVIGISQETPKNSSVSSFRGDITHSRFVDRVIGDVNPDIIFHLAAQSSIVQSFDNPSKTVETNVVGTVNILEAIRKFSYRTKLLSVGSSAEYGQSAHVEKQLSENDSLLPTSPYAVTKVSQSLFCSLYRNLYKIRVAHVRLFAIIGPGKKDDATSDFARGIAEIEKGKRNTLLVGDLTHARDFMDVRDASRALILIAQSKKNSDSINLCTGKKRTLKEILTLLVEGATVPIQVKKDPAKRRLSHDSIIVGNPKRLHDLGFKPKFTIDQTLTDILNYWRKRT